jgi:hypothetical protein
MKRTLIAAVLSLALVFAFGAGSSVFAADDQYSSTEAYLVKYLEVADGVTVPDTSFTFTFAPKEGAPEIDAVTLKTIVGENEQVPFTVHGSASEADGNSIIISESIANIISDVEFPNPGVYKYDVAETPGEAQVTEENKVLDYTYSQETYLMNVMVKNDGTADVVIEKTTDENGEGTTGTKVNPVEDPTVDPSTDPATDKTNGGKADAIEGFSFTNKVQETIVAKEDPEDPDSPIDPSLSAATVSKEVTGEMGNKEYAFPFTLTASTGAGVTATTATAYVYEGTKKVSENAIEIDLTGGTDFNLAHGQSLVFTEVPAGVKFTVTENLASVEDLDNLNSYTAFFDGNDPGAGNGGKSATSDAKTVNDQNNVTAACTNAFDDESIAPTGIIINNLPYIILILLAVAGIVVFTRKRRYQ